MSGWKGIGPMTRHPRVRRVDLGDLVRYRGEVSTVYGVWLDAGQLWALLRLASGDAWVPSQDCDALERAS